MTIRTARPDDRAQVALLLYEPMKEMLAGLLGSAERAPGVALMARCFAEDENQYSWRNMLVQEDAAGIGGVICGYDGARLPALRAPVLALLRERHGYQGAPEDETGPGEFYLDSISVAPGRQGQGIGSRLIEAMVVEARQQGFARVGLLVHPSNPAARRLYERLGFAVVGERPLLGDRYFHLQREL